MGVDIWFQFVCSSSIKIMISLILAYKLYFTRSLVLYTTPVWSYYSTFVLSVQPTAQKIAAAVH